MNLNPIEILKEASNHLRGTLAEELLNNEPGFSKNAEHLLKSHGLYQQKDRDHRGQNPPPTLMLRGRIPGGRLTTSQYLAWDDLADRYGDGSLRLTTRQSVELHGVVKGNAKATIQSLVATLQTTQGASGDVVRNVTQAPNPWGRTDLATLDGVSRILSDHFLAKSHAYPEIWLDEEKVDAAEPFYGRTYLPRKFKIAISIAGENLVDLYTNDLAFAASFENGTVEGFFVFAGGGMGMSHGNASTFPRLADLLGWISEEGLIPVSEAVVSIHRDLGNRSDRKRARLKYLIQELGVNAFRTEVERRAGRSFEQRPLPEWKTTPVLGWLPRAGGTYAYGLHILAGRIQGELKAALRSLITRYGLNVQISPDQDLILMGIQERDRHAIADQLTEAGGSETDPLSARVLACVALPLCPLAITEGERALPDVLRPLRQALVNHGLLDQAPVLRLTGCANGCARPYTAELALVGHGIGRYILFAGGSPEGTRLAFPVREKIAVEELPTIFEALISHWAAEGRGETFGDFAARVGARSLARALEVSHG